MSARPTEIGGAAPATPLADQPARDRIRRELPATVVDLLGLAHGSESPFPGRSLARFFQPGTHDADSLIEPVLSEVEHQTTIPPLPWVPAQLVLANLGQRNLVDLGIAAARDQRRHAADGMRAATVAGLDQQLRIYAHERHGHRH